MATRAFPETHTACDLKKLVKKVGGDILFCSKFLRTLFVGAIARLRTFVDACIAFHLTCALPGSFSSNDPRTLCKNTCHDAYILCLIFLAPVVVTKLGLCNGWHVPDDRKVIYRHDTVQYQTRSSLS